MQVFYAPEIAGHEYTLTKEESKHVVRVMRMGKGEPVKLIDGKGNLYEGIIEDPDQAGCRIGITGFIPDFEKRNYSLHIAISPLKNADRFEWFIEKCIEIGTDEITPLLCMNTGKPGIRRERLENIIVSAMKQSLKAKKTILHDPVRFDEFLDSGVSGRKMISHCSNMFGRSRISDIYNKGEDAVILIGPEGDFGEEEIKAASGKGYEGIHLGKSRLRTETAGIAACYSVYFMNQ